MLKNNKAFTLIEVLVGSSILFIIIITIVPINSLLESERNLLSDRYDYTKKRHYPFNFQRNLENLLKDVLIGKMFEVKMKKYAYMDSLKNHNGFSMVSMLATISVIFLSIPFVSYLLNSLSYTSHYESLSVNQ